MGDATFQVPSIFDAEVLSALRGLVRGRKFDHVAAADLVVDLMVLPVERWPLSPLLPVLRRAAGRGQEAGGAKPRVRSGEKS